ncbi:DUF692 domain-containing protein [Bdellovibrio sp. HCB290]|uniref:DUF692 domain-containing protein n=1 Tax=Bdellovibrio sp. HCB290 TaxID=3394356 RepID=UPI0039B48B03
MRYSPSNYKVGMSLHNSHFAYLQSQPHTDVAWLEATTEEYLSSQSHALEVLKKLRHDYPIALHGTYLNIGNPEGPDLRYLRSLRNLIENIEPFLVSDHISWSGSHAHNMHGLFPMPFNEESLQVVSTNIDIVQNHLKHSVTLENIATYVNFADSDMSEIEFISELARRTGCGIVLDLSALFVNSINHGFCPRTYLKQVPMNQVKQVHLSGPTETESHWLDKKATAITTPIWGLFQQLAPMIRHLPIAVERIKNVPDFNELEMEVIKASFILESSNDNQRSTAFV